MEHPTQILYCQLTTPGDLEASCVEAVVQLCTVGVGCVMDVVEGADACTLHYQECIELSCRASK